MRADIVAGAVFPDYELTAHTGKRRKLSELQGPDLRNCPACVREWVSRERKRGAAELLSITRVIFQIALSTILIWRRGERR